MSRINPNKHCLHGFMILSAFLVTSSKEPNTDIESLIYEFQHEYCGSGFCKKDPSYKPPLCQDEAAPHINATSEFEVQEYRQIKPPCSRCSCEDSCVIYGNCCADKHIGGEYYFDCQEINMNIPEGFRKTYSYMVTKCLPDAKKYSPDLAKNCEHGELGNVEDGRLVTAAYPHNTTVTFRNKYCAMCYDVKNYTSWDVYITCDEDFDSSNHKDINSLIRSVSKRKDCLITTLPRNGKLDHSTECLDHINMVSACNVTGEWQKYNASVERACGYYLNPAFRYRNLFCALCNGIHREELLCPDSSSVLPYLPGNLKPFSAILNFDNSDVEVVKGKSQFYPVTRIGEQKGHQCRVGDNFDAVSRKCRETYCPLVKRHTNRTCVDLVPTENYVVTTWKLAVYFIDDILIPYGLMSNVSDLVIHNITGLFKDFGFTVLRSSPRDYARIHSHDELIIRESRLEFGLLLKENASLELSRQRLEDMTNLTMNITRHKQIVGLYIVPDWKPRNITDMLLLPTLMRNQAIPRHNIDLSRTIDVPLVFNVSCPMYRFESHEVLALNNSIIIHGDTVLHYRDYFQKDANDYFICVDAVFQTKEIITKPTNVSADFLAEQIVTLTCISCSLFFLLVTLLVYILITELHTVPGLNLILLAFSLFVAQALYLFGAGAVTTPNICIIIGVLIHYFWLVAFAWMNVCCIHMFRVFTNLFKALDFADDKKCIMLKYSVFAFGVPLVIVSITIALSFVMSDYTSVGYGGSSLCFVASGLVSTLSFGVPAGVTVLTNTVLLIYTVVSLRQAENEQNVHHKSGASDIFKFVKLSVITGLSWVFGFLGYFLQRVELMYVFTVMTAGQGIFIFLSFVVSRRIFRMIRDRIFCTGRNRNKSRQYSDITSRRGQTTSESLASHSITSRM